MFISSSNAAIKSFGEMIKSQVLANDIMIADNDGTETEFFNELNNEINEEFTKINESFPIARIK